MQLLEWYARAYDELPLPHQRWGREAIRRLQLAGDETVMELGCGTGRDEADLRQALSQPELFDEPVDAALSVATLHWLPDHDVVFQTVAAALSPGGRFVAEAGGAGNVDRVRAALRAVTGSSDGDGGQLWNFAGIEQTTRRLRRAGFTDITVELVPDSAALERGEQLEAYLAIVVLGAQLRELPARQRRSFVHAVARELGEPVIDYVRLRIDATRASPPYT
ncbi:MAG: class I SAM-dependent methyltransferase [Actinobacteria bacterium]|nr:class I SAM-dependent methyltransferase [Actinomycetota bacterium]